MRPYITYSIIAIIALAAAGVLLALAWQGNTTENTNASSNAILPTNTQTTNRARNRAVPTDVGSILFMGDIMMGRYVETLRRQQGEGYVFEKTGDLRSQYDAIVANLEGPIVSKHSQTPDGSLVFSFDSAVASALYDHGITAVSLANNHTLNQGEDGLQETRAFLEAAGVQHFGDPRAMSESNISTIMLDGQEVILVGVLAISASFDTDAATQMISTLQAEHPGSLIVVYPHWGEEYAPASSSRQQSLAHALIDAGADAVIGSHPHVVQELELYKEKLIAYSLGNFIFDQYFSEETQEGLALGMRIKNDRIEYALVPLKSEQSQPEPMGQSEAVAFLERMSVRSSDDLLEAIRAGSILLPR